MILYGSSYTEVVGPGLSGNGIGISCFYFNDETGELKLLNSTKNRNSGYFTISKNKQFLYTFQEVMTDKNPVVVAFEIQEDFSLKKINELPVTGGLPCHISLLNNDNSVAVTCYETGSIHLFSLAENGGFENEIQVIQHTGKSVNELRQEAPHAHQIVECNQTYFVPDLGIDTIKAYTFSTVFFEKSESIDIEKGAGPRHIVFHPSGNIAFVISELTAAVFILKLIDGVFKVVDSVNSLPHFYNSTPSSAAIKLSADGKFLYVSNRGCNTIAIFKFEEKTAQLHVIDHQNVFGETPRDFTITPNDKWVIVANQDSNTLVVFKRDRTLGTLLKTSELKNTNAIVCVKCL